MRERGERERAASTPFAIAPARAQKGTIQLVVLWWGVGPTLTIKLSQANSGATSYLHLTAFNHGV